MWNKWREEDPGVAPDLSGADLRGPNLEWASLRKAGASPRPSQVLLVEARLNEARFAGLSLVNFKFRGADLRKSRFDKCTLDWCGFRRANLHRASFAESVLSHCDLSGAKLRSATLRKTTFKTVCDMTGSDLTSANLTDTDFVGARWGYTTASNVDLSSAHNLERIVHSGPSTLGVDTLRLSQARIPDTFLRQCGLSDWEIESAKLYNPDLTPSQIADIQDRMFHLRAGGVIQYYSCFISYSSQNQDFARRLHDSLQDAGVRCWFAPEDMKIEDRIRYAIDQAIHLQDQLLLILSRDSVASPWLDQFGERSLDVFVMIGGRMEAIGSGIDPWCRCG